jgi:hypothetical protein
VAHDRIDLLLPAPASEDAVVADTRLHVVTAHVGFDALAQPIRRRLTQRAEVVPLTLDRGKGGAWIALGSTRWPRKSSLPLASLAS